jgi:hypothetical protein
MKYLILQLLLISLALARNQLLSCHRRKYLAFESHLQDIKIKSIIAKHDLMSFRIGMCNESI